MSNQNQALKRQEAYIEKIESGGFDYGLTVAGAFVRSIRNLGYRSPATALDELIDNALEAGASNVHIAFGYDASSDRKPVSIAIIDDGYGMVPKMIRAAVVWGGTDREGSRNLFGRYGYGLPSASVSQGKRFRVISRVDGGVFFGVTMDVDEISEGKHLENGRVVVPAPSETSLPDYIESYAEKSFPGGAGAVRTVVEWDRFDHLLWKTTSTLEEKLREHIGLIYRGFLRQSAIRVNGKPIEPVDPLFITPGYRYYDIDEDVAEAFPPLEFPLRDDEGVEQVIRVRFSLMPPGFLRKDKSKKATKGNANPRFPIRRDNNGIIVCRNGRQIDCISRGPAYTAINNDTYVGIELDFPAALDEEFGVTTSKQQITFSDRVWNVLKERGFERVLSELRNRYTEARSDDDSEINAVGSETRPSEAVMTEAAGLIRRRPDSEETLNEAANNLKREIDRKADESGVDRGLIEAEQVRESTERPFKVEVESIPGAPFFRVEQRGGQLVLLLNRSHRFFIDVYSSVSGSEGMRLRAGLELLLFAIGQCELDATNSVKAMYVSEKIEWSNRLSILLGLLGNYVEQSSDEGDTDALVD